MPRNSINLIILAGRLGGEPDIRYTPGGAAVANASLATNEGYMDKTSNSWVDKTEWHRLVLWHGMAEMAKNWGKGDWVSLQGKKQTRKWFDKDNNERETVEIVVSHVAAHFPKGDIAAHSAAAAPSDDDDSPENDSPF